MSVTESVPTTWDVADEKFFRIVATLLDCKFLAAGSVLLAAND